MVFSSTFWSIVLSFSVFFSSNGKIAMGTVFNTQVTGLGLKKEA